MKLSIAVSIASLSILALAAAPPALAQLEVTTIRGVVTDQEGHPLSDVQIGMEYKGESRQKITKSLATDKKGAFIRAGLRSGNWVLAFSKEGYKPRNIETWVSGGGISEIPPVVMVPGPAPAPGASPAAAPAPGGKTAAAPGPERAKQLSATYNKGLEAMTAGKPDEAEALFKAALAEMPELAEAHTNLGYIYVQKNDTAAAEAEFRKVVELRPASSAGYVSLATLLGTSKREEEAMKVLSEAAPRFEQDARFQFALAATAFNRNVNDVAEAAFVKVTQLDPANAEAYFFLGSLALNRGDVAASVERLEKYLAVAPPDGANVAAAKALLASLKKTK